MQPTQLTPRARLFDPEAMARWLVNAHAKRQTFARAPKAIRARTALEA